MELPAPPSPASRLALAILAWTGLAFVAAARPATGNGVDERAPAPAPLVSDPIERWSFGPLAFESEPEPWGTSVLVTGRDPSGRRALVLLDAETGRVVSRALFSSTVPLATSASLERAAVRTAANRVDLLRLRGGRLLQERSIVDTESVSAPLLAGTELTLREGGEIARYDLGRREPLWRARVPGAFHGTPALVGGNVLAGWYEPDGNAHLAWLDGATGRGLGDVVLGRNSIGRAPDDRDALLVVPHAKTIFVRLLPGLKTTRGAELAWARAAITGRELKSLGSLHDFLAPPLETEHGWLAPERSKDGGVRWILVEGEPGSERLIELSSPDHHAWLSACTVPAGRAGDVLYVGPCATDVRTLEVLWRRERAPTFRPVPVPGGLLVVEGDRLRCLGSMEDEGKVAHERARELVARGERALGEELARIARQASRTGDAERAARLADEAADLGASERALGQLAGQPEGDSGRAPTAQTRIKGAGTALAADERAVREDFLEGLVGAAGKDAETRVELLREVFARDPENAPGLALLCRSLPAGARVAASETRAWLDFLELGSDLSAPIELVGEPAAGEKPSPEQVRLAAQRKEWRADAIGYRSGRLLLVTAGAPPDAVARIVRTGELACDVLESVFERARGPGERLEVLLYPTREDYLARSGKDLGGIETVLGFTSGHFDVEAGVSRLFLPAEDERGTRLLDVSTHELTHHWLATRSGLGAPRAAPTAGGFWVVEAIATWAEELRLDPERHAWSTAPERAASIDTLANASPRDLLPWRSLLQTSFDGYCKLETRPVCELSLDWQLGMRAPRSPMQLFYAQGAALAHYLYEGEGGANRALLVRAVESYYRGQPLDLAKTLGTDPDELGERVLAWARSVHAGSDLGER